MSRSSVFFVGYPDEVRHHAAPFTDKLNVRIIDPEGVLEFARPGDLAIFFTEHFDRFRNAIGVLKERQVATLYLIDGILEWRNAWENRPEEPACPFTMRPVLSHKAACIGASQARMLEAWENTEKVEIVGIPRLDRLRGMACRRSKDENSFRVLVMTAKVPGFTPQQIERTRESLLDLKHWLEQEQRSRSTLPDKSLHVYWRLTAGLEHDLEVENQLTDLSGSELVDQLLQVDAVISTPSTAMLEGMILGLPVAALDYHNCPSYFPTAWTINHKQSIPSIVAELSQPPECKRFYQQTQLIDALAFAPLENVDDATSEHSATNRLIQLIQKMQEIAQNQVAMGEPLHFPRYILPAIDAPKHRFDHAAIYPDFPDFFASDSNIIQVELAHARREIEHLQRELTQLRSELDQAHAIFDQIQQHPVAGPIVRLRQKFLDWFSRNQNCVESK